MPKANILKLVAGVTAGVMLLVALFIFICPQIGTFGMAVPAVTYVSDCSGDASVAATQNSITTSNVCMTFHLAVAQRFTNSLLSVMSPWFVMLFLVLAIFFVTSKTTLLGIIKLKLITCRQYYRQYGTSIKLESQEKKISWLSLLENNAIASIA